MDINAFLVKKDSGEIIRLNIPLNGKISIGRETVNDILLEDPTVSRVHCSILNKSNELYIRDENSTNGTSVNDAVLTPNDAVVLHHGDVIRLARCLFVFKLMMER